MYRNTWSGKSLDFGTYFNGGHHRKHCLSERKEEESAVPIDIYESCDPAYDEFWKYVQKYLIRKITWFRYILQRPRSFNTVDILFATISVDSQPLLPSAGLYVAWHRQHIDFACIIIAPKGLLCRRPLKICVRHMTRFANPPPQKLRWSGQKLNSSS